MTGPHTDLTPGDVVGYRGASGRWYLLAVRAVRSRTDGRFPIVDLLDHDAPALPEPAALKALNTRLPGDLAAGDAWWVVTATVRHRPGADHADLGFVRVGHTVPLPPSYQHHLVMAPPAASSWVWWRRYLDAVDQLTTTGPERAASWLRLSSDVDRWQQWWFVTPDEWAPDPGTELWPSVSPLDRLHLGAVSPGAEDVTAVVVRLTALFPELGSVPVSDLPVVDDDLCDDVLAVFDTDAGPDRTVCSRSQLEEFLVRRRGRRIASHESDTAFSPHRL